ncbi:MAG: ABC transporter ATP-binding protein [Chloroflexi bacterium]|nr:ABC transporter ATP-binding protein [Chloroflexota bacterium]
MLVLDKVSVSYGRVEALHGISLEVRKGEIVALIGANGAGKSTTLRAISGVLRPTSGQILFDDRNLTGMAPERVASAGIAHVPEGRRVFPGFTVGENLEFGGLALGRATREIRQEVEAILEMFPRLRERYKQYAWSLSGGEQQMLVIGRGLVARPQLLMLDEPSLGLAPTLVDQVYDVIEEIRARGTTILLVEQNASMALAVADRGYVLELGRVVLEGSVDDLANNEMVKHSYLGTGAEEFV